MKMIADSNPRLTMDGIAKEAKLSDVLTTIKTLTKNFYTPELNNIELLAYVGIYNKDTAPFRIRHKLPHHLLISDENQMNT